MDESAGVQTVPPPLPPGPALHLPPFLVAPTSRDVPRRWERRGLSRDLMGSKRTDMIRELLFIASFTEKQAPGDL